MRGQMARYHRKPAKHQKIAKERIEELFRQAKLRCQKQPELAKRYVSIARRIGMKYKVSIPRGLRRMFCRHCSAFWTSGNSRVRLRNGMLVMHCLECRHFRRFRYK